jgi:hypothetical protein
MTIISNKANTTPSPPSTSELPNIQHNSSQSTPAGNSNQPKETKSTPPSSARLPALCSRGDDVLEASNRPARQLYWNRKPLTHSPVPVATPPPSVQPSDQSVQQSLGTYMMMKFLLFIVYFKENLTRTVLTRVGVLVLN